MAYELRAESGAMDMASDAGAIVKVVLLVHQSAEMYGSDKVLLHIANGLMSSESFKPLVVLPNDGPLRQALELSGVETHLIPVAKISRASMTPAGLVRLLLELWRSVLKLRSLIRQHDVAIVHSNTIAVLGGAVAAFVTRTPHVWHVHELIVAPALMRKGFPRLVGALADWVICISRMNARWLVDECPSLGNRSTVIWNGLPDRAPVDESAARVFRTRAGALDDDVLIAFVGRFNRWKGQLVLIDALDLLWQRGIANVRAVFVGGHPPGEPHHLEQLRSRIASSRHADRIAVMDFMDDVSPVWDGCDIAVVPSTEPEPFGLVAIEAMAASKPVVAAGHGGLLDIVEHQVTGLLVQPGDVHALGDALAQLVADGALRREMGQRGRQRQQQLFSLAGQVVAVTACYERLTNG